MLNIAWLLLTIFCCVDTSAQQVAVRSPGNIATLPSLAQYVHRVWGIEEGLPQNTINSLCQTRDGYIWFGTSEGLVRFDGVHFTLFTSNSSPALTHNFVSSVKEDSDGALWVTTFGGGINRLMQGKTTSLTTEQGLPHNSARTSMNGGDGTTWVGTNRGVGIVKNGVVQIFSKQLDSAVVSVLFKDSRARVWIGTRNQGLFLFEQGVFTPFMLRSRTEEKLPLYIKEIVETADGKLWVATSNGLYSIHQSNIKRYSTQENLPSNQVQSLMIDIEGSLWIGTQNGLCRMDADVVSIFPDNHPLQNIAITSLLQDKEGNIWVGTYGQGLHCLHKSKIFVYPELLTMQNQNILSVAETNNGTLLMGTTNGVFFLPSTSMQKPINIDTTKRLAVYSLLPDNSDEIWLGTANGLYYIPFPHLSKPYTQRLSASHIQKEYAADAVILSLAKDSTQRLWIGTQNKGLLCLEKGTIISPQAVSELRNEIISSLTTSRDGTLWITTWNGGLWSLSKNICRHYTEKDGMKASQVLCTLEDADGTLWFGTFGSGIYRLKNGVMKRLSASEGLANDVVHSLLEDNVGNIWGSFGQGIFRVSKSSMNDCLDEKLRHIQCKVFGMHDGMKSSETSSGTQPVSWYCRDGRLLFATIRGVAEVLPSRFSENTQPPHVILEYMQTDSTKKIVQAVQSEELILDASIQRVEWAYTATSFSNPAKVRFRYMLEGYDATWIEADTRRAAYYTNLPRGRTYRFRVIACNSDGVWNTEGAAVNIYLQPHLWETWWAISIYAICGTAILVVAFRTRERVQRKRLRERFREREAQLIFEKNQVLEEANTRLANLNSQLTQANEHLSQVNEEKTDILGVVAHDLKNPVIGIQKLAYSMEGQAKRLEETTMQESATIIKTTAERMFQMIQQLLKVHAAEYGKESLLPKRMNIREILEQLQRDWQQRAQQRAVEILIIAEETPTFAYTDPLAFLQVVENLLSNAIKASYLNSTVELHCRSEGDKTYVSVKDSGIGLSEEQQNILFTKFILLRGTAKAGMPSEEHSTGLGLYIVKKLVDVMNGEIHCQSAPNQGSIFTVILPNIEPSVSRFPEKNTYDEDTKY